MNQAVFAQRLGIYRELSKSGIVALVLISVFGGYLVGQSPDQPLSVIRLALTLLGILFLAGGSSALNQLQEREVDQAMPRTSQRPLPSGRISANQASAFVAVTIGLGLAILWTIHAAVLILGIAAVVLYNGLYTMWWKKHWAYAAVPGAIPGALPILMGYAAASSEPLNAAGLYLFFLLFFWQMPHFWVLALRYRKDYEMGGFPTLPVAYGAGVTVFQISLWCMAYVGLALIAPLFLRVGLIYLIPSGLMIVKLLRELRAFARNPESKSWLHFFLWVNFSLILFIGAAVMDLWSYQLLPWFWTR